jgi:hypothetical protein
MTEQSEEFRRQAREATRNLHVQEHAQVHNESLGLAQAFIALARNEEWLEGEVSPVENQESRVKSQPPSDGPQLA